MQVIIDEVVSNVTAIGGAENMSPQTLQRIVSAVLQAVDDRDRQRGRVDEEQSLHNYQQRNQPWTR
jgi:hypothetical protein